MRKFGLAIGLAFLSASVVQADDVIFSSKSRLDLFQKQLEVLDGRAKDQYRKAANGLPRSQPLLVPTFRGAGSQIFQAYARNAADQNGIPQDLFLRLIQQESAWN